MITMDAYLDVDSKNAKVLVVVAHPDDEIIGCYGLLSHLKKQGHDIYIRIMHNGNQDRYKICTSIAQEEGFNIDKASDDIFNLIDLSESRALIKCLDTWINDINPTIIVSHGIYLGDHQEHRIIGNLITTSWLRYKRKGIRSNVRLLRIMPFPNGMEFYPNTYKQLSPNDIEVKKKAFHKVNDHFNKYYLDWNKYGSAMARFADSLQAKNSSICEFFFETKEGITINIWD